jgi:hypothetical protein
VASNTTSKPEVSFDRASLRRLRLGARVNPFSVAFFIELRYYQPK